MKSIINTPNIKKRIFQVVFLLLLIRVLFLVLIPPFIGIANNGDFERLMAPVGISYSTNVWATEEGYYDHFWRWVTNDFVYNEPINNGWHQVFSVFPRIAILLSNEIQNGQFDIRFMGITNVAMYFLAVATVFELLKSIEGKWSYILLLLAVIVLGDSYIIQYFNSFYAEPGSVAATLMAWCLQIIGFLYIKDVSRPIQFLFLCIDFVVILFAVMCKQQDLLFIIPALVVSYLLFKTCKFKKWFFCLWAVLLLLTIGGLFKVNTAAGNTTAYNVTSMDLLANSMEPETRLEELGFSESEVSIIMSGVGNSVFTVPYDWTAFRDAFDRTTELKILSKEPMIFVRMINKRCQNLFIDDVTLGNYMKSSGAEGMEKTKENRLWYTIKNKIYVHSFSFYIIVILVAVLLSCIGLFGNSLSKVKKELFYVYLMLPISNVFRLITIMLGDSSHDDIKHFFTINFEFDVIFLINIVLCVLIFDYYFGKHCFKKKVFAIISMRRKVHKEQDSTI